MVIQRGVEPSLRWTRWLGTGRVSEQCYDDSQRDDSQRDDSQRDDSQRDDSQRDDSTCFEELVFDPVRFDFQAMKNPWST